jgi:acetyl esterase
VALVPEAERYVAMVAQQTPPRLLSVGEARARRREQVLATPDVEVPLADVHDGSYDGPEGPVAFRVYRARSDAPGPMFVYFHGGGWVLGDLDQVDVACRLLAQAASGVVLSVDYRLAPEHPYPVAVDEAVQALGFARAQAAAFGADPARIVMAGDSSGATVAIGATLKAWDQQDMRPAAVLVAYPPADPDCGGSTYAAFADGYGLTRLDMQWYWRQYLGDRTAADAYAAPLRRSTWHGFPPTVLVLAEYDVLREDGERLAAAWARDGVIVRARVFSGLVHGFFTAAWARPYRAEAVAWAAAETLSVLQTP